MSIPALVGIVFVGAVCSAAIVWTVREAARRRGWLDLPTPRSSHEVPTPVGGGIGVVAVMFVALVGLAIAGVESASMIAGAVGLGGIALLGWLDDVHGLSVGSRLSVHMVVGAIVSWIALGASWAPFDLGLPPAVLFVWWVFWTVSAINVVNFIDGADGLIGLQTVVFGLFVLLAGESTETAVLGASLAGAAIGFLVFNWEPASIFLGDVGSGGLAVAMLLAGVFTLEDPAWSALHAFLPLMPLFADELTTMVHRLLRGERLTVPHRDHAYQILVRSGWTHARVALLYGVASSVCASWALYRNRLDGEFLLGGILLLALAIGGLEIARWRGSAVIGKREPRREETTGAS